MSPDAADRTPLAAGAAPRAAGAVAEAVAAAIHRHGPLPLDRVLDMALYDPTAGFYERGGRAGGREGDFLTSPEVGPLFGRVVGRALDGWWRAMGSPDPYVVVDAGAGPGTLCRTVLAAAPACAPALRYVLVERSATQRAHHAERLRLEDPALAFAPVDPDTESPVAGAPPGPICVSLGELPRVAGPAVVLANELLDNLPFGLAEWRGGAWHEVRVDLGPAGGGLVERLVPLADDRATLLSRLARGPDEAATPGLADGARVPLQDAARAWLRDALAVATPAGRVVAIDYATTTADLAARPPAAWLRTYRGHARGGGLLDDLGAQDVTCEVATDQLALVRPPSSDTSQAAWLRAWGIDDLVEEGRRVWTERAAVADLAAVAARSRIAEAEALLDPTGLGAFRVLEWAG
ncbi:MAG TPA: SAM-dependent methyltransferase [Acidimicrobiales bacterium]|nr:SAM-dependent methyltransferase [Acidimicrobiales bacterium]